MKNSIYHSSFLRKATTVLFWITVSFLCAMTASAQKTRAIQGLVVDEKGEPVIGATVVVPNSKSMTITDLDGKFELKNVPSSAKNMEISYIGYQKMTIVFGDKTSFRVQLKEDNVALEEVVVIGYGTTKRGNVTNAIASLEGEEIEDRQNENVLSSLQGQLAGVEITTTSGAPGGDLEIHVRGSASINAEDTPLYVVDGIPVDDLTGLNPSDIATIDVLKDASSSAIYGSRGANGVILITTKMPKKAEKTSVQFTASYGIQQMERKLDILSPEEWIEWRTAINNRNYVASYGSKGATADDDYDTRTAYTTSTQMLNDPRWYTEDHAGIVLIDWQDAVFRSAPRQTYTLSLSNSTDRSSYRVSLGYVDQQGIAINTSYKRLNARVNMQTTVFDKLTVGFRLDPSMSWLKNGTANAVNVLSMVPVAEEEAGLYTGAQPYERYAWAGSRVSPVAVLERSDRMDEDTRINMSAFIRADIIDGLRVELTGSYNYRDTQSRYFLPSSISNNWATGEGYYATGNRKDTRRHFFLGQAVANYDKKFGKHTISAMAGASIESTKSNSSQMSANHFPDNELGDFNMSDEDLTRATVDTDIPVRLISLFGRVQYEFDNRYLVMASIRRDGSSKFGSNKRWGIFPAVSAAYRISNEAFWPENAWVHSMKIRASWGANGNNRIDSNAAFGEMSSANYAFNSSLENGFAPSSAENPNLTWEKVYSWDIGLDFSLLRNRISFSLDYYQKTTSDLLYEVTMPAVIGYESMWDNVGEVQNQGFELELKSWNLKTKKYSWMTSFNFAYNKNKVTDLGNNGNIYSNSNLQVLTVGEPMNSFYMYDAVGVYQYSEDLRKYATRSNSVLGDVRYRDVNDDGVINDSDRTLVGKPDPDFVMGMTNKFTYKNFDLSILCTAQFGGYLYSLSPGRYMDNPGMAYTQNVFSWWKNMWISEDEPGDGKTPSIDSTTGELRDTRWLYRSDYIRVKNITLGYKIPISKKIVQNARVYLALENVWLWDKYPGGYSPENRASNSYPQARVYTLGANFTF